MPSETPGGTLTTTERLSVLTRPVRGSCVLKDMSAMSERDEEQSEWDKEQSERDEERSERGKGG